MRAADRVVRQKRNLAMPTFAIYDRKRVREVVRCWSPQRLAGVLRDYEGVRKRLSKAELDELASLLREWEQRALGPVMLRDAMEVDPRRGVRVYDLLCTLFTLERYTLPLALEGVPPPELEGEDIPLHHLRSLVAAETASTNGADGKHDREIDEREPPETGDVLETTETQEALRTLETLVEKAETSGLALTCYHGIVPRYPFPADLETLISPLPSPYRKPLPRFEPPTGWRRYLAIALVGTGVALVGLPLFLGHVPTQPAGFPLGFLTLGLLVGIRAGWPGYLGGACIWLVANLPAFHHGATTTIWALVPLLLVGALIMALDRNVRILWNWIWSRRPNGRAEPDDDESDDPSPPQS